MIPDPHMKPTLKLQLLALAIVLTSTGVAQTAGWTALAPMTTATPPAAARKNAVAFSIGTKGYIGTGENSDGTTKFNDLWQFDASTLAGTVVWTQMVSLPAPARSGAVGFSLQTSQGDLRGYLGTGEDASGNKLNDFYSYNPVSNSWGSVGTVPGLGRSEAVGFSIGNMGYVGLGKFDANGTITNVDFYELEPVSGTWTAKAQFPVPGPRVGAVGFGIGFHGFVGTGLSGTAQTPTDDFWLYDQSSNQWVQRKTFPGSARAHATGFSLVGYGFIGTGNDGSLLNDFFRYNPDKDRWTHADPFGGSPREGAVGFSIGDRGFLGTGDSNGALADLWQFVLPLDCSGIYGGPDVPGASCDDGDAHTIQDSLTPGCVCKGLPSDRWELKPVHSSVGTAGDACFSLDGFGYVVGGQTPNAPNDPPSTSTYSSDYRRYSPEDVEWQITNNPTYPGRGYRSAVGFSIGSYGYVGTGIGTHVSSTSPTHRLTNDFWRYDPGTDTWTQIMSFEGGARRSAVGFSIGNFGYVGLGQDSLDHIVADFWRYDPVSNDWDQMANFGGGARARAVAFTIGNKAYVATGNDGAGGLGTSYNDVWEFDPSGDHWRPMSPLPAAARYNAVAFSVGSMGYLGTGVLSSTALPTDDFWEFDPANDDLVDIQLMPLGKWTQMGSFGGSARLAAVGFSIGQKGYLGTGSFGSGSNITYLNDFWEYTPTTDCEGVFQGPARPGKPCDDNNQFTSDDVYNANCQCVGDCSDADHDGICDGIDDCYNVIFPGMIGSNCDDDEQCTVGDVLDDVCACHGILLDTDFDGIPNCAPDNCPSVPGVQGGPCDDHDPCTTGTTLNAACVCTGGTTPVDSDSDGLCDAIDACPNTPSGESVNAEGCSCSQVPVNDNDVCTLDACANGIATHTFVDTDGDGICDGFPDPCPLLPNLAPGDPCPCSNPCDINCFVTPGCNCLGTYVGNDDNDNECNALDPCPLLPYQIPGDACDDGQPCTVDDVIDALCECHGTGPEDHDNDNICDPLDTDWSQKTSMFDGRYAAAAFSIADSGYICTGANSGGLPQNDLWRYDASSNSWEQKAFLPGVARTDAVGFAIGNKGYVGTGDDHQSGVNLEWLKDFYEYDPVANTWVQKADLGAGSGSTILARGFAIGFGLQGKGYIGSGYGVYANNVEDGTAYKHDLWAYDPLTDHWEPVADPPGRVGAIGFAIGDKGYVGMGHGFGGADSPDPFHEGWQWDLYEFDPLTNVWTKKANLPASPRWEAVGFSIGSKGYVTTGSGGNDQFKDLFEYDPGTDAWTRKTDLNGAARSEAAAFAIADSGYVVGGRTGYPSFTPLSDVWRYVPSGCTEGAPCSGPDPCMSYVFDANCTCVGTLQDADNDGTCDANDGCPNDPDKIAPGTCGCNVSDADSDGDGIADCIDGCPNLYGSVGDACGGNACMTAGTIDVNCQCAGQTPIGVPPTGDVYATAITLTLNNAGTTTISGNNQPCYTSTYTGPQAQSSPDVWYSISTGACASGNMIVSLCGAGTLNDTYLHILDAAGTTTLANNDDNGPSCSGLKSSISLAIAANTTYIIVVEGFSSNTGTFTLAVTVPGTVDSDGDGTRDCADGCPSDANKIAPGTCGCGNVDHTNGESCDDGNACTQTDTWQDCVCMGGNLVTCTASDACHLAGTCIASTGVCTNPTAPDTDGDGTCDNTDGCPTDPLKIAPGQCGCSIPDTDSDGDGIANCIDNCPNVTGQVGSSCNDGNTNTINDVLNASCVCVGTAVGCTGNQLTLTLNTDGHGNQTSWDIVSTGTTTPALCSGSGYANNSTILLTCCLPNGCYNLRVFDSFGDGINPGGYTLYDASNNRIIDNAGNGAGFTTLSQVRDVSNNPVSFCVPISTDALVNANCDQLGLATSSVVQAQINPAVTAQYGMSNATSGYQFWVYNPNGGFSRRIFFSHSAPSSGVPTGTANNLRSSYFQLSTMSSAPAIPSFIMLNVRVRSRVNNINGEFGPACRMKIDPLANCATTQLTTTAMPIVSCNAVNVSRTSGVLWSNAVSGANKYQFEFVNANTNVLLRRLGSPTRDLHMSTWGHSVALPTCNVPYNVRMRVSFDGGTNYCSFGAVCAVTFACAASQDSRDMEVADAHTSGVLELWPNPNNGDQLTVHIEDPGFETGTATIDVIDLFGKHVISETINVDGSTINYVVDLRDDIADGLYIVNVTTDDRSFTQRLVIAR